MYTAAPHIAQRYRGALVALPHAARPRSVRAAHKIAHRHETILYRQLGLLN